MTQSIDFLDKLETPSNFVEKTDPDLRRQINKALADRNPPTYRGVYDKFRLADHGVSYHSFYRYARRLRFHAAAINLAELTLPQGADVVDLLPRLLACRLLEAVDDESVSPKTIHRLAQAWRIAAATRLTLGRHAAELENLRKKEISKENDRFIAITRQYLRATNPLPRSPVPADPSPPGADPPPTET